MWRAFPLRGRPLLFYAVQGANLVCSRGVSYILITSVLWIKILTSARLCLTITVIRYGHENEASNGVNVGRG